MEEETAAHILLQCSGVPNYNAKYLEVAPRSLQQNPEGADILGRAWVARIEPCTDYTQKRRLGVELRTEAHIIYMYDTFIHIANITW